MLLQPIKDLEDWHKTTDPWKYEKEEGNQKRKTILLDKIPKKKYENVLDIGCGQGFITKDLPGKKVTGVDISKNAIKHAKKKETKSLKFRQGNIFEVNKMFKNMFDLIIITGVIYPQYVGEAHSLVYLAINEVLREGGILMSVHIDEWYKARFPFYLKEKIFYDYRDFVHRLEIYVK